MRGSALRASGGAVNPRAPRGLAGAFQPRAPRPRGALPLVGSPASEPSRSDTSGPQGCAPLASALKEPCSPRPQRGKGAAPPFRPIPVCARRVRP